MNPYYCARHRFYAPLSHRLTCADFRAAWERLRAALRGGRYGR